MNTEKEISNASFSEALLRRLKGKTIEVYSGDTGTTRQYSQDSVTMKEVVRGILQDAEGELMVLEVYDPDTHSSNIAYINAWNVRAVVEPKNGMSVTDIYSGEHEKVRK